MHDVMRRAADRDTPGIRLLQAAHHHRSLSLYAKLGFQVRDLLAVMQGSPPKGEIPGYQTRRAAPACRLGHARARSLLGVVGAEVLDRRGDA